MAKQLTILEKKKKNQRLLIIIGVIFFLSAIVLFMGLNRDSGPIGPSTVDPGATRQAAQVIIQDVTIPRSLFEDKLLEGFMKYIPISAPSSWGRENPFTSF
ncbi:MAG: hypothetical protein Q8P37_01300 [Candidatus Spechtbacteria bacterium]|nr:hypothetical protein [Candidatus Spechtbacteria bacterium]